MYLLLVAVLRVPNFERNTSFVPFPRKTFRWRNIPRQGLISWERIKRFILIKSFVRVLKLETKSVLGIEMKVLLILGLECKLLKRWIYGCVWTYGLIHKLTWLWDAGNGVVLPKRALTGKKGIKTSLKRRNRSNESSCSKIGTRQAWNYEQWTDQKIARI